MGIVSRENFKNMIKRLFMGFYYLKNKAFKGDKFKIADMAFFILI